MLGSGVVAAAKLVRSGVAAATARAGRSGVAAATTATRAG